LPGKNSPGVKKRGKNGKKNAKQEKTACGKPVERKQDFAML
jgi:hypothetical protein